MRGNAAMRIIFDRWTVIGIVLVVVVRLCQGAAGMLSLSELESASCATDYSTINNIGLALFAFLPLYLVGLQGAFAVVHKDFFWHACAAERVSFSGMVVWRSGKLCAYRRR